MAPRLAGGQTSDEPRANAGARPVVVRVSDGGFDWADAAIGAAAALAAVLVAYGLVLTVRTPRQREPLDDRQP